MVVYQFDAMARGSCEMPDAFFASWVRMGIIRAEDLTERSTNFMFATTFFAIVSIFVKSKPIVASANVRTDSIATLLLTTAVVHCTLILI